MVSIPLKLVRSGEESELLAQGWIRQTTINEPRLSEIAENYRQLGYEVRISVHRVEDRTDEGCNTCFTAGAEMGQFYGDVYIRKGSGNKQAPDDELF